MSVIVTLLIIFVAVGAVGGLLFAAGAFLGATRSEGWMTLVPVGFSFLWLGGLGFIVTIVVAIIRFIGSLAGSA